MASRSKSNNLPLSYLSERTLLKVALVALFVFLLALCLGGLKIYLNEQSAFEKQSNEMFINSLQPNPTATPTPTPLPILGSRPMTITRIPKYSTPNYQPTPNNYSSGEDSSASNYYPYSGYSSSGTVHVNGYYRSNGTYVQSYTRHAPRR